ETEIESLLDLIAKYFQSYSLESHYRSKSLPLIQFSNSNFYNDKLSMLPDRHFVNSGEIPFTLIRVAGIWDQQTNRIEAEAVIAQLKLHHLLNPQPQIGVIT